MCQFSTVWAEDRGASYGMPVHVYRGFYYVRTLWLYLSSVRARCQYHAYRSLSTMRAMCSTAWEYGSMGEGEYGSMHRSLGVLG
eukprot:2938181-Rhodomonas_salina.1